MTSRTTTIRTSNICRHRHTLPVIVPFVWSRQNGARCYSLYHQLNQATRFGSQRRRLTEYSKGAFQETVTKMAGESNISLTPAEDSLRSLLLDVASYISPNAPMDLRFTGGWVRDKLLGIPSHDIDVGISDMTGYQFGLKMKEYLSQANNESRYGVEGVAANLHKIEANPEKSKHLETVTTKIFGLDVDLVNLRKETYSEDSRNPQMEFGSPKEDALRRDATINAMFYNLQTRLVEDLTGNGHDDMRNRVIRTPLEPFQTYKDDPLRVLRLIRFASRFGYDLDPDTEKYMGDATIKAALRVKISRERIGVEVEKMLKGPNPLRALTLIDHIGLYDTIFTDPERMHDPPLETHSWSVAYGAAASAIGDWRPQLQLLFRDREEQAYLTWILAAIVPWADVPFTKGNKSSGKEGYPPAVDVVRNGLKCANKISDVVNHSVRNAEDIIQYKDACVKALRQGKGPCSHSDTPTRRDTLGMNIRKWGQTWRSQILYALLLEATRRGDNDQQGRPQ